jgi:predicted nicotinamide N-methyase
MDRSAIAGVPLEHVSLDLAERRWRIAAVRDQTALLAASARLAAFPFGLILWESAPVLAEALAAGPLTVSGRRVLELGAGTGLAGLVAQWLGASVLQIDHNPDALELCRTNAGLNAIDGLRQALANWSDWRDDSQYDLVIGSDVLYDREAHAPVLAILERNLAAGGHVLLTDPGRQHTPLFAAALEAARFRVSREVRRIPALAPAHPGQVVEVTIIRADRY